MQGILDIACAHLLGIQADDLLFQFIGVAGVSMQDFGLTVAVAVARYAYICLALRCPHLLVVVTVATVATVAPFGFAGLVAKMVGEFLLHRRFERVGEEFGEDAILAEEIVHRLRFGQLGCDALGIRHVFLRIGPFSALYLCHLVYLPFKHFMLVCFWVYT